MDPRLLHYYTDELLYMRELAGEFAEAHPKIARRMGMQAAEIGDAYVERMIESFSFMSARMQMRLDDEFPRFTQPLLQAIYPNYLSPTPSMSVARLYPGGREGDLRAGHRIARGTAFIARVPDGEKTACEFRSSQDVTLYPLEIVAARLTGIPPDIPALDRYVRPGTQVRGALRLRLHTTNGAPIASLEGLDRLPVYLCGDEALSSHLFELLHAASLASVTGAVDRFADQPLHAVTSNAVVHEGIAPDQSLLPLHFPKFHGHNLLHEYFACPSRFYFFALTGLEAGLRRVSGCEAEVVILLERSTSDLADKINASSFALFCTPVINLFPRRTDRIELPERGGELHLVPVQKATPDYEVFSVTAASGQVEKDSAPLEFRALHQALQNDEGSHSRYFTTRREMRELHGQTRRYGTHTRFVSSELFVSLVNRNGEPYDGTDDTHNADGGPIRYLSLDTWLTNRDLPRLVPRDGKNDLTVRESAPITSIGLIHEPSVPQPPYARGGKEWELVGQLSLDALTLGAREPSSDGLGKLLRLFLSADATRQRQQIESLASVKTQPVTRKLRGKGELVFGRGIECVLTVDERGFSGRSPYLLGLVLEHYLARHVSAHSFTQTELRSVQRGRVARWPVRSGTRGVL